MALFSIDTLGKAAAKGRADLVKKFLEEGHDPNKSDSQGVTPLQHAANKGHLEIVKILVEKAKVDIDKRKEHGFNALMYAVFHNHHEVALYLLNNGATTSCSADEYSPLHYVIMNDKKPWAMEIFELMLRTGANPNCVDKLNQTPLEHAFNRKNVSMIKLLVAHGGDVSKADKEGFPILHRIIGTTEPEFPDRLEFIEQILQGGFDPNLAAPDGTTPLHMAARRQDQEALEIVNLLMEHGADPERKDSKWRRPLEVAEERGGSKMQGLLRDLTSEQ
jgi:ankyrin repeat protein